MKLIKLTKGLFTKVDNWNYLWLNQYKWGAVKSNNSDNHYARRTVYISGKPIFIIMHRLIMKTGINQETDHIDTDTLNNQEYNLRNCTHRQNCMNRKSRKNSKSRYLGVYGLKNGKWQAGIRVNGIKIHLGTYSNEIDAALEYNKAAKIHNKEFANLNKI